MTTQEVTPVTVRLNDAEITLDVAATFLRGRMNPFVREIIVYEALEAHGIFWPDIHAGRNLLDVWSLERIAPRQYELHVRERAL